MFCKSKEALKSLWKLIECVKCSEVPADEVWISDDSNTDKYCEKCALSLQSKPWLIGTINETNPGGAQVDPFTTNLLRELRKFEKCLEDETNPNNQPKPAIDVPFPLLVPNSPNGHDGMLGDITDILGERLLKAEPGSSKKRKFVITATKKMFKSSTAANYSNPNLIAGNVKSPGKSRTGLWRSLKPKIKSTRQQTIGFPLVQKTSPVEHGGLGKMTLETFPKNKSTRQQKTINFPLVPNSPDEHDVPGEMIEILGENLSKAEPPSFKKQKFVITATKKVYNSSTAVEDVKSPEKLKTGSVKPKLKPTRTIDISLVPNSPNEQCAQVGSQDITLESIGNVDVDTFYDEPKSIQNIDADANDNLPAEGFSMDNNHNNKNTESFPLVPNSPNSPNEHVGLGEMTLEAILNFDRVPNPDNSYSPDFAYKPERAIRKKAERAKLPGWDCDMCRNYYEAIASQLTDEEMKKLKNKCSRHRSKYPIQLVNSPPDYWDPGFPTTQECIDRKYMGIGVRSPVAVASSPKRRALGSRSAKRLDWNCD